MISINSERELDLMRYAGHINYLTHEELKNFVLFCGIVSHEGEVSIKGKERMCKFYNGTLITHLKEEHVMARLVNTKDYGQAYEHVFVLIPLNEAGRGVYFS